MRKQIQDKGTTMKKEIVAEAVKIHKFNYVDDDDIKCEIIGQNDLSYKCYAKFNEELTKEQYELIERLFVGNINYKEKNKLGFNTNDKENLQIGNSQSLENAKTMLNHLSWLISEVVRRDKAFEQQLQNEFNEFVEANIALSNKIIEFEKKETILLPDAKARIFKEIAMDINKVDNAFSKNYANFTKKCNMARVEKPREVIGKFLQKNKEKVYTNTR